MSAKKGRSGILFLFSHFRNRPIPRPRRRSRLFAEANGAKLGDRKGIEKITKMCTNLSSGCADVCNQTQRRDVTRSGLLQHAAKLTNVSYFFDPKHLINQDRAVRF